MKKRETGFDRAQQPIDKLLAYFEIKEKSFTAAAKKEVAGKKRVPAHRPGALKNALIVVGGVFFLFAIMTAASKKPLVLLAGVVICILLFVIVYLVHPTYCPGCGKEMEEKSIEEEGFIFRFNYCEGCSVYTRPRRYLHGD